MTVRRLLPVLAVVLSLSTFVRAESPAEQAKSIMKAAGIDGGLIVHLGCGDGKLTAALRLNDGFQVHGLDRDDKNVQAARRHIQQLGIYGVVSVDRVRHLPLSYIDNLVNLVVAEDTEGIPESEVMRIVAPGGVAYVKQGDHWKKTVKPRPKSIDEWTHYLHDAGGNAVAHDDEVGPPRRLQWLGNPRWSRHHDRMASMSAMVSAGGRVFYIMDEGSRVSIQLPPDWKLICRDAFNGVVLWKRDINRWHSHLWPLKSGPTQLARRLVATGDSVYVTLGLQAPVIEVDAATGQTIQKYEGTGSTEELLKSGDKLFALLNPGESELIKYAPQHNVGDQRRVSTEFIWDEKPRQIAAIQADSGSMLWKIDSKVSPLTLAAQGKNVFYHDGNKLVCLDRETGEEVWSSPPADRRKDVQFNFGPKLVVHEKIVLFAGGDRTMRAYDTKTGKELWNAPHARGGYQSPEDLLVAGGLVWSAPTTSGRDSGVWTGRDIATGEVKVEFPPDVDTYWFHHRCYIAKATDKFLLPSRTGIEFVDVAKKDWEIHHWVRGGCLYGVMPCNGLLYAPPHNCACYPEAKLYGLNALAPAAAPQSEPLKSLPPHQRLERGPAFEKISNLKSEIADSDWPTYRGGNARAGFNGKAVPTALNTAWEAKLDDKLSALVIAGDKVYVARPDRHMVSALDRNTGEVVWNYTGGGRIDSPPTVAGNRVVFGSTDGWVNCLNAEDGELAWRYLAAPLERRLPAFEQLESVWPVHGSVLIRDNEVWAVAGRSAFLDGGMRLVRLNLETGEKLSETVLDDRNPETGENLQERLQVLNMPVGLPDIMSTDGKSVYMRSQRFELDGTRAEIGPHSGDPAGQGSVQRGETAHLFAPMGFLDDTYFHRSYWVYGRSFAGGHAGYYQAGKFAPAGRILVNDDKNVYGFARKEQYYRWTTTLEHQLFATSKEAPEVPDAATRRRAGAPMVRFAKKQSLNPTRTAITVEAWINPQRPNGVVLARGGPARGYALIVKAGKPQFLVRETELSTVAGKDAVLNRWHHVAGVLTEDQQMLLYVDGKLAAKGKAASLITGDPQQSLEIGGDDGGAVGEYTSPHTFNGAIDEVRIHHAALTAEQIQARADNPQQEADPPESLVLSCSFDDGKATDVSGRKNHGEVSGAEPVRSIVGQGLRFAAGQPRSGGSFVEHHWANDITLIARAMVLADKTLFVAGPPDVMDEEDVFAKLVARDDLVNATLEKQQAALDGKQGGLLCAVSATDGKKLAEIKLPAVPEWDGMAAAGGRLFLSTTDGRVICLSGPEQ